MLHFPHCGVPGRGDARGSRPLPELRHAGRDPAVGPHRPLCPAGRASAVTQQSRRRPAQAPCTSCAGARCAAADGNVEGASLRGARPRRACVRCRDPPVSAASCVSRRRPVSLGFRAPRGARPGRGTCPTPCPAVPTRSRWDLGRSYVGRTGRLASRDLWPRRGVGSTDVVRPAFILALNLSAASPCAARGLHAEAPEPPALLRRVGSCGYCVSESQAPAVCST